jgi:MFS transporter, PAT family, beta-lactamase induction signal transducer AmpG
MTLKGKIAPVWLMGMANMTFGLFGGFVIVPLPQLLAAQHVPEEIITRISGAVLLPGFWVFLLGPILDVRFSRRWYATIFAAMAGICLTVTILYRTDLAVVKTAMVLGYAAAAISSNALFGWLSTIIRNEDESKLSSWSQVAALAGNGLMAVAAGELIRGLPLRLAASMAGLIVFAPALIFLWMPAPGPDRRLASESFRAFFGEVLAVVRKRDVLVALALFLAPAGSFALTNTLGGLGVDFHASERMVGALGGVGTCFAGIVGSLLLMPLARLMPLRPLYLAIGIAGAVFTATLLMLPHTPATFGVAMVGENIFQALAFAGAVAICLETIGRDNPLAATQFGLLSGATALPIVYMGVIDGRAYSWHGVTGEYVADAGISLVACALLAVMLMAMRRGPKATEASS